MSELPTIGEFVRARASDTRPGLLSGGQTWTWAEHTAAAAARAAWYGRRHPTDERPRHVGVLLENVPEYSFWLAAAAVGRFVLVGLNPTRSPQALAEDVRSTQCDLVLTDQPDLIAELDVDVLDPHTIDYLPASLPGDQARPDDLYLLIFTSGTTGQAKAVKCSQGKIATMAFGLTMAVDLTDKDTTYLSMPMFHSNAIITNWAPALAVGATIALKSRFSASSFLDDCRRANATYANYVGTPLSFVLAQPPRPDDADNPLVRVFGNEGAPADLERFAQRFGCRVIDGFGSTEGGISITRTPDTPAGSLGRGVGDIAVVADDGRQCPTGVFNEDGRLANADEAVGELVNRDGGQFFEGYWNAPDDEAHRRRGGWYWSGDLGYTDDAGFLYFAGRSLDRLRVSGENMTAAPIARMLTAHPDIVEAVVYAVPDPVAGDQVMAAIEPTNGFDPTTFPAWVAAQPGAGKHDVPAFLRVGALPRTATGKVIVRELAKQSWYGEGVWIRDAGIMRPMTVEDGASLSARFQASGRPLT